MLEVNYLAVVVAAVAAFVVSAVWYSPLLFGKACMRLRGMNPDAMADMRPPAGELLGEMPRKLYAMHVGDALVKTLLMSAILGVWR